MKELPIFLHPCQIFLFSVFLIMAILVGVNYFLIVVMICIPLMDNDVENLFVSSLAIHKSSMEKSALRYFAHFFKIRQFIIFIVELKEVFMYSKYKPPPPHHICLQIVSPIVLPILSPFLTCNTFLPGSALAYH